MAGRTDFRYVNTENRRIIQLTRQLIIKWGRGGCPSQIGRLLSLTARGFRDGHEHGTNSVDSWRTVTPVREYTHRQRTGLVQDKQVIVNKYDFDGSLKDGCLVPVVFGYILRDNERTATASRN